MKTLMILRHAKSPHVEGVDDHERPIFADARQQVALLAKRLAARGLVPEVVLTSDALRAVQTAEAYAQAVGAGEPVQVPDLYEPGDPDDIIAAVRQCGGAARALVVVGHNPGLEDFCNRVTPKPAIDRLGTGAMAILSVTAPSWSDLRFGEARLERVEASH
jgi:phosphohistidine phosphatase